VIDEVLDWIGHRPAALVHEAVVGAPPNVGASAIDG
jgi:hypothetical protein